jgi:hypothetical protein
MQPSRDISRLIEIMAALRGPGTGCGWDIAHPFETIVLILPCFIRENEGERRMSRADASGLRVAAADIPIIIGMVNRGDRRHDIAAWFGLNQGKNQGHPRRQVWSATYDPWACTPTKRSTWH